ncbi:MAG: 4Fe-4S dicluster domain-containing protein, partial [Pseudomonadales bacterium]|nr:4Fe-4S dicluster domain-containing protein [Pseudomonadales bacterium]
HVPLEFVLQDGKLAGMRVDRVEAVYDENGKRSLLSTGQEPVFIECDDVLIAIGQENAFPWIEKDLGLKFDQWDCPVIDKVTFQSSLPQVFFGGDAAFGPENIITAVAHGHQAAVSIDLFLSGKDLDARPAPLTNLVSQKMSIHEWSYDSPVSSDLRYAVPHANKAAALANRKLEVELGFNAESGFKEAQRCLNCDVQTVFFESRCIECDACVDICPTDCITFTANGEEPELRSRLSAPAKNTDQALYVSEQLPTDRVLVKDENVCLHCGLCSERCPTNAWDMQKYLYGVAKATPIIIT